MKTLSLFSVFLFSVLIIAVMAVDPAFAGPGGKIASAIFESFWGKVILVVLVVFFLPLIIYTLVKEKMAERRALRDLKYMARFHPAFDWLKVRERITDCVHRVHDAWRREEMSEASNWMTDWYWQNQQMVHIDRWEREGLTNVCNIKKIVSLQPILFAYRNDGPEHDGSVVAALVTVNMQDYLVERTSGNVVEGSKKYKDIENVWSFALIDGQWRVSNIEDPSFSLDYAGMAKELPAIEELYPSAEKAGS